MSGPSPSGRGAGGEDSKNPTGHVAGGEKQYKDYEKNPFLFGCHEHFAFVIKVAVDIVSSVSDMHGAGDGINAHIGGLGLVVSSSLSASGMRLSAFRMCHFTLF
mgnify:CR=1 FL=1